MSNPPAKFEHYELLKNPDGSFMELGHGAMGVTYKAFDTSLHCHVALKMISSTYLHDKTAEERFLREARGAAALRHRNVASVFHLGQCGESHYYAMEFIDGETVDDFVKREGAMSCPLGLEVAAQVASALMAAHAQGLVHRDIKPSNLMLARESDGELLVKVIDFGLVKSAMVSTAGGTLTSSGFVGTPYFASPEQLDQRPEDVRSDIYSLGVTLWFMLTGKPTFLGSVASVIMQHLERQPSFDSLAVLPAEIVALLRRMLEKDVDKRFQTPALLRSAIKQCLASFRASDETVRADDGHATSEVLQSVALSASRGLRQRPGVGTLLDSRYRLVEDLNPGNPGRTFHAEDTGQKRRVRVKIVEDDDMLFGYLDAELAKLKAAPNPSFIAVLAAVRPATRNDAGYVVLEWIDGFSLLDVLRARRELTPREAMVLLEQLAPAIDAARRSGLKPELSLRDILVDFPDGFDEPSGEVMLRCPLAEWPVFAVKLNPLGRLAEFEQGHEALAGQTMVPGPKHGTEVAHLGRIAYDLLGGCPTGSAPLANLPEQGNDILRRCMNPETTYGSAADFVKAFGAFANQEVVRAKPAEASVSRRPPSAIAPAPSPARTTSPPAPPPVPERRSWNPLPWLGALAGVVLLVAGIAWLWPSSSEPTATTPAAGPKAATPVTTPKVPLRADQPWKNSLGMAFLPLGDIHFAKNESRVRDFEAFVNAKGYDAVGGMFSLQRDGFKQHGHGWKNPGFPQTPDDPVVGVSWEDANQFCAWLTQKERAEGLLGAAQFYRLPSDREWSLAVGLPAESGPTPEAKSGRVKAIYPWGRAFPPPPEAGNYAGAEARANAPENWPVIARFHDSFPRTCPVGSLAANASGIGDLAGNVWEWCLDPYNKTSRWRVLRGGSWATSNPDELLSSFRRGFDPNFRHDDVGFRCVIATEGR